MNSNWQEVSLSDIGRIVGGATPSTKNPDFYDGDIVWITPKDLSGFEERKISKGARNITQEGYDSCSTSILPKGSILFSSRAPIGYVAIAGCELCTNQGFKSVVPDKTKIDEQFLYYALKFNAQKIESMASGTTFREVSGSVMKNVRIKCPKKLSDQKKIANILSCIDDKIEVNNKITNILWSLISLSYQTIIGDPSCSQGKLSDISQFVNEKADCTEASVDSYIGTENIFPNKAGYTFAKSVPNTGKVTKFSSGDTLISNIRPYFKKIVFAETAGYCSNDVLCFRPKTAENSKFLYSILYQDSFFDYMTLGSKGTKMPRGDKRHIMNFNILIPNDESLLKFSAFTAPIFSLISNIRSQNKLLTQLRELILPKLLSGEIELKNQ